MAAPFGNQNAKRGQIWTAAIDRALSKRNASLNEQNAAIDALAECLLKEAEGGDVTALKELGDRLEGKPAQSVTLAGDPDSPVVHRIERVVVRPATE